MANEFKVKNGLIIETVAAGSTDYDRFLVLDDSGIVKQRTGAQILSDIGAQASGSYLTSFNNADNYAFKTIAVSGQSSVVADSNTDTLTLVAGSNVSITTNATGDSITIAATPPESIPIDYLMDVSRDESSDLAVVSGAYVYRFTRDCTIVDVRASVTREPIGQDILVDITLNGVSIFNQVIQIDDGTFNSKDSSVQIDLATTSIADGDEIKINITQVGTTAKGAGLKITFKVTT